MQNQPGALGQGGRSSPAGSGHGAFSGRDFRLAGFVLVKNLLLFIAVSGTGTDGAVLGVIYRTAGGLIMAAILAGTVYIFYVMLVWQKAYNLFNVSFKNKYVLDTIRQLPGFSELRYNSQGGFTRQELQRFNLLPSCMITYYKASDELRGILDGTRFRASSVSVGKRASGCRSLPDIVFEGQIIGFETFDSQKSSSGYIQVMDWKLRDDMARRHNEGIFNCCNRYACAHSDTKTHIPSMGEAEGLAEQTIPHSAVAECRRLHFDRGK